MYIKICTFFKHWFKITRSHKFFLCSKICNMFSKFFFLVDFSTSRGFPKFRRNSGNWLFMENTLTWFFLVVCRALHPKRTNKIQFYNHDEIVWIRQLWNCQSFDCFSKLMNLLLKFIRFQKMLKIKSKY